MQVQLKQFVQFGTTHSWLLNVEHKQIELQEQYFH